MNRPKGNPRPLGRGGGQSAELERTMIVGRPSSEQEKFFKLMLEARETAFKNIKAGIKTSDVDKAVRKFFKEKDLMKYWRHHTGHGIGLDYHEAPFFDNVKAGLALQGGVYL